MGRNRHDFEILREQLGYLNEAPADGSAMEGYQIVPDGYYGYWIYLN